MNLKDELERIKRESGTTVKLPLPRDAIRALLADKGLSLPPAHFELIGLTDGLMVYGGYFRLFGLDSASPMSLFNWNASDLWKFAWGGKVDRFLCFGETAWGDQYAYRLDDLERGGASIPVFTLDALEMARELEWSSFEEFLEQEVFRNAIEPYDSFSVTAREMVGDLDIDENILFVPSPLISGEENPAKIRKISAATAMVINGDLWMQLGNELMSRSVDGVQPYTDEKGRARMKVIWANS